MAKKLWSDEEVTEAKKYLESILTVGMTVYTVSRKPVSRSGTRIIGVLVPRINESGNLSILDITRSVAIVTGSRYNRDFYGVVTGGWGMDFGFHVVYSLGRAMYPDGVLCAGRRKCYSNDHFNGDKNYSKNHKHGDGGYSFHQEWI